MCYQYSYSHICSQYIAAMCIYIHIYILLCMCVIVFIISIYISCTTCILNIYHIHMLLYILTYVSVQPKRTTFQSMDGSSEDESTLSSEDMQPVKKPKSSKSPKKSKVSSRTSLFHFGEDNFNVDAPFLFGYPLVTPAWLLGRLASKGARVDVGVSSFMYFVLYIYINTISF